MRSLTKILVISSILSLTSVLANEGETIYKACASCHGAKAEKVALGKSQIIKGWDKQKIVDALKGYKAGTYGGAMKGVMKGQVARLDDEKIQAVASYISTLK
ncbi:c-type cytochrome [Arcobacter sp.]|uniref:c-type cytochrome n=1 Tax=unclassified Arcobacter TaxID=2593671 RepID=UPI003B00E0B5